MKVVKVIACIGGVVGLLSLLSLPACAVFSRTHLPRFTDGTLDVRTLVSWAEYGVEADCEFAPNSTYCIFGRDAIADTKAAMDRNPGAIQAAARQTLIHAVEHWPALDVVFRWLIEVL